MANVVIDIATQYTGNPAFKKATNDAQKLEKSVAKLGKQLASVFAASKVLAFGKASVKAFAEDEKAARSLALALANTGNAFAAVGVENFIADLQRATGVLDDNLRPAFRTLLTATGDVKKSQDGLALALDIAAGTGKDLSAVSMALAKAYGGQTTALSRLGAGLDKATLKTGDMDVILGQLTDKFKGQALAAAEGYSGSIAKLTVASQNAKEIIGKDLLDSMQMIAGKDGIGGAATAMEGFATQIGNAIYGIGVLTAKIKSLPGANFIADVLAAGTQFSGIGLLSRFGKSQKAKPAQSPGERKQIDKINADALKIQKQQNDLKKIDNANTLEKLKMTAGEKALAELKRMFDLTGIELQAALNGVLTKEEEARVKGLIAINNSDGALAIQALSALNAAAATNAMTKAMEASLAQWGNFQTIIGNSFQAAAISNSSTAAVMGMDTSQPYTINPTPTMNYAPGDIPGISGTRGFNFSGASAPSVNIQINPAVAGLIDVIQNQSASGISPTVNRVSSSYIA